MSPCHSPKPPTPLVSHTPMPLLQLTACFPACLGLRWARLGQSSTMARQSKTATIGVTTGASTALCLPDRFLGRFVPSMRACKWPQPKAREPIPLFLCLYIHLGTHQWSPCTWSAPVSPTWLSIPCLHYLPFCPLPMESCCHPPIPAFPSAPALVTSPVCSSAGTPYPGLAPRGTGGRWGCQRWL